MRDVRLSEFSFTLPVEVRFSDLDAMGHVNNAVYFTYFEEARSRYWLSLTEGPTSPRAPILDFKKIGFIVVHAECDYAAPAEMGEPLLVGCRIAEIRRSSFVFDYRIISGGMSASDADVHVVATGKTIQALYDWEARKTVPFSEELRKRIEAREGRPVRSSIGSTSGSFRMPRA